jgi:hypothetical protein
VGRSVVPHPFVDLGESRADLGPEGGDGGGLLEGAQRSGLIPSPLPAHPQQEPVLCETPLHDQLLEGLPGQVQTVLLQADLGREKQTIDTRF